ncbi:MAG: hypothetical protein ACAI44_04960 [Candidatus Sericytochromatia bacterium]
MPDTRRTNLTTGILAALALLDLSLTIWAFGFPDLWFSFFHASPRVDPQALLYRCGANWLAFTIIQALALFKWRRQPWWLLLVAGCRLGDSLTDITCLLLSQKATLYAWLAFPAAGIGNLLLGTLLIRLFQLTVKEGEKKGRGVRDE